MPEDRLESVKKEIRSVIITFPKGVVLDTFRKAYKELIGIRFPTREFGYISDVDFLCSLQDVVRVHTDREGNCMLNCVANDATEHIQKLVTKQRIPKQRTRNSSNYVKCRQPVKEHAFKVKPFVSAPLRLFLFQLLSDYPDGLSYHSLLVAYKKKFKRPLNLDWLSDNIQDRLEKMATAVSELEVKVIDDTERLFYCPDNQISNKQIKANSPDKSPPAQKEKIIEINLKNQVDSKRDGIFTQIRNQVDSKDNAISLQTTNQVNGKEDDISAIPRIVINCFEKVLKLYPDGILAKHFPFLYEKISGKTFDLLDFGYNNFLELTDSLPEVFITVKSYEKPNDWILFHTSFAQNASLLKEANAAQEQSDKLSKPRKVKHKDKPSDIAFPFLSYAQPQFPSDLNLSLYVPVFISAIVNPSCFWFKLQIEEVVCRFRELEDEMQVFYDSSTGFSYKMEEKDINVGSICVALFEDHWYRVRITSFLTNKYANVYLVDYGNWEKAHFGELRYLKNSFMSLPSQAFKAHLALVKPANQAKHWCENAETRFLQLCSGSYIMARIHLEFEDMVSVFLCDTSGMKDIHINDTLMDEGLAESSSNDALKFNAFEQQMNQISEIFETPNVDSIENSISCADQFQKPTVKERNFETASPKHFKLVKSISLGDGYKIHLILIQKEVYVSVADVCNLFWYNKPFEVLLSRLEFKNIEIPNISISKMEHENLFQQCESECVKGFEESTKLQYSVSLYPLLHVMKVLNCLGHPSVKIRDRIKRELETFNQQNEKWMESFNSSEEFEENDNGGQDEMSKYCEYDLKAMYEAIKCKRMKLQKNYDSNKCNKALKELEKVETLSEIIKSRIEFIRTICSSYSMHEEL